MAGLSLCEPLPVALIIVHMNQPTVTVPEMPFPVQQIICTSIAPLPLAAARNAGMAAAETQRVVFLDVDCIPSPDLLRIYGQFWNDERLLSGQVRYLPKNDNGELFSASAPDPIRQDLQYLPYELFWSLNFGCSKAVFNKIGGFDERFTGYGAEDTDFAFTARKLGVPLDNLPALVFHQHHTSHDPPLNHLNAIVHNSIEFFDKWGVWPMEGWLNRFAEMGLVRKSAGTLEQLRDPSEKELALALKS